MADRVGPEPVTLRVAEVVAETADAHSLVFDATPAQLPFRPGQFLTLRIPGSGAARCYSLSASPFTDDRLKVTVKRVAGGHGSNWICDHVTAGSVLEALPPSGTFTPRSLDGDLLLLAGGSGITPVMSILKSALSQGSGRVVLVYANRDEASVIFAGELRALAAAHPGRLTVVHWLESVQGVPTSAQLAALTGRYTAFEAFVCGPEGFMDAATTALGGAPSRVHVERFRSLTEDPFAAPDTPVAADGEDTARVEVDLDGEVTSHDWPRSARLLDVLLAAGRDAPYSCREGACSACACRIVGGEVEMVANQVLDETDLAEGWVLACQSVPRTDQVKVTYEE